MPLLAWQGYSADTEHLHLLLWNQETTIDPTPFYMRALCHWYIDQMDQFQLQRAYYLLRDVYFTSVAGYQMFSLPTRFEIIPSLIQTKVSSQDETDPVLTDLFSKLDTLPNWGKDWPEHRSAAPDQATIERAREWILGLYHAAKIIGADWIDPLITASEESEVTFEWWRGEKKLTVYVTKDDVEARKRWREGANLQREEVEANTPAALQTLWAWVAGD